MKVKLLILIFLTPFIFYSQTQIGADIDGEAGDDHSGQFVSLSSDGSTVAIGAFFNGGNGTYSGHVRMYKNNSGVWTQIGNDIEGEAGGDWSGWGVSLSSEGSIVAIGARNNDGINGNLSGHVRVYQYNYNYGNWEQIGADIDGEAASDYSGSSVSLSSNGTILAIGAGGNDGNGDGSGHVRVYQNNSGVWEQLSTDINGEAAGDYSGSSVSLSSEGTIVAIGAINNDENGVDSGHVRVYEYNGLSWTQLGTDIDGEATGDHSGFRISLSSNGNTVAIGAYSNDGINGVNSGHVRVYENDSENWTQIGDDIDGEAAGDYSGYSLSLSSDGSILAIGAIHNIGIYGGEYGHVRVYQNISDVWTQIGTDIDGEAAGDQSGADVSLSSDGSVVAIGSPGNDGSRGQVRVYDLSAVLSLVDNEISKNFTLYPNPVNNYLQIQLAPTLEFKEAIIYNYFGQQLLESKKTKINVCSLSTGIYFIEVETNQGKGVKKILIE